MFVVLITNKYDQQSLTNKSETEHKIEIQEVVGLQVMTVKAKGETMMTP